MADNMDGPSPMQMNTTPPRQQQEHASAQEPLLQHVSDYSPLGLDTNVTLTVLLVVLIALGTSARGLFRRRKFPTINAEPWDPWLKKAKASYRERAKELIQQGFEKYGGQPFYLETDNGPQLILPAELMDAVNKESALSFDAYNHKFFLSQYDTFKQFKGEPRGAELFQEAIMKGLTKNLPKYTFTLSNEMSSCLEDSWGNSEDWHEVSPRTDVLDWVSRLSSRIFAGPVLCRNEDWLRISRDYTVDVFLAVSAVKEWPRLLQWFAERFGGECRKVRAEHKMAHKVLGPILAAREEEHTRAAEENRSPDVPDDAFEWFRTAALTKGIILKDVETQIGLSLAAIHTTSDLITQSVVNLCKYPEVIPALREEALDVLSKYGWQKLALTEVRLLDSFLKETQRMKPIAMTTRHVIAKKNVTLPGGIQIRKGEMASVSSHRMWSDAAYEQPKVFDAARFVKRRENPSLRNNSLLVSTSPDHMAFSHGKHACPGRFFAANEAKIALLHLLLKYDFRLDNKENTEWLEMGEQMIVNPFVKISVRRRKEEIDLASLKTEPL